MFKKKKTKLKLTGRAGMIYTNVGRTMHIDSEMLACGEYDMVIYEHSMRAWQSPHDTETISDEVNKGFAKRKGRGGLENLYQRLS